MAWASDRDGPLDDVDGTLDPKGAFSGEALLTAGIHVLTATVTDLSGASSTDEVTITVAAR